MPLKYIVANWKGKKANYEAKDIFVPERVKVILCLGHNGEVGFEVINVKT